MFDDLELNESGLLMPPKSVIRERRRNLYEETKALENTVRWWEWNGCGYRIWKHSNDDWRTTERSGTVTERR